jgi:transportin-3
MRMRSNAVADTIHDCAGVLSFGRCLGLLLEPLRQLSAAVAAGGAFDWRAAEAALYCVR